MDKIPPTNPPISPNANYFGNFNGRNSQNNQNSKDSSQKFKKFKDFFVTMLESFKKLQSEEHNNDSTNTITNSDTTAQILIPTNPYGSGNGGNNKLDSRKQEQSATIEKNGRDDSTAYNGGFTQLLGEEDERTKDKNRESRAMGEGNERAIQLGKAETYITAEERDKLYRLLKEKSTFKPIENIKKQYKNDLESAIKDSLKGIENAKNTIQLIKHAETLDKILTKFKKAYPNESKNDELIKMAEKILTPLKEKYLPKNTKENTHKSKSKSNDDFGMGM